jgi:hypothetical protein
MAAGIVTTVEHILDSRNSTLYNGAPNKNPIVEAQVAQSVEHCTENAGVGGSIPPLGTTVIISSFCISYLALKFVPLF